MVRKIDQELFDKANKLFMELIEEKDENKKRDMRIEIDRLGSKGGFDYYDLKAGAMRVTRATAKKYEKVYGGQNERERN